LPVGVVQILQPFAGIGIGQKEVPQARGFGLVFGGLQQFELPRCPTPALFPVFTKSEKLFDNGLDVVGDVLFYCFD